MGDAAPALVNEIGDVSDTAIFVVVAALLLIAGLAIGDAIGTRRAHRALLTLGARDLVGAVAHNRRAHVASLGIVDVDDLGDLDNAPRSRDASRITLRDLDEARERAQRPRLRLVWSQAAFNPDRSAGASAATRATAGSRRARRSRGVA